MTIQDMAAALAARDAGIESSAQHAEDVMPGWQDKAVAAARLALSIDGALFGNMPFKMEDLREWCLIQRLGPPPDLRSWGAVTVRLIREGIIEKTGQYAPAASSNGSAKPLYRRKGSK